MMKSKKSELVKRIKELQVITAKHSLDNLKASIKALLAKIDEDVLRISVIGEFNHGKTTFINALLNLPKKHWLKMDAREATSVLTELQFGPKACGVAYTHEDDEVEFELTEISQYTTGIPAQEKYKKVVISYPNELLKSGVVIIDTPGVNSLDEMKIASAFKSIKASHAAMYITSRSEIPTNQIEYIADAFGTDIGKLFIVSNPGETLNDKERMTYVLGIKKSIKTRLQPLLNQRGIDSDISDQVYSISALDALKARLSDQVESYKRSGMEAFEKDFWSFIQTEKYEQIYKRQVKRYIALARMVYERLLVKKETINYNASDFDQKTDELRQTLESIKALEKELISSTHNALDRIESEFMNPWSRFLLEQENLIGNKIHKLEVDNSFGSSINSIKKELDAAISIWVNKHSGRVSEKVADEVAKIEKELEARLKVISDRFPAYFNMPGGDMSFPAGLGEEGSFNKLAAEIILVMVIDIFLPGGPLWALLVRLLGKNFGDKLSGTVAQLVQSFFGGARIEEQKLSIKNSTIQEFEKVFNLVKIEVSTQMKETKHTVSSDLTAAIKLHLSQRIEGIIASLQQAQEEKKKASAEYAAWVKAIDDDLETLTLQMHSI
jgi:hypothetical protein